MNTPDWKDAPEWANWLAMDGDESWFWYEHRPELANNVFGTPQWVCAEITGTRNLRATPRADIDPQSSLQERPR